MADTRRAGQHGCPAPTYGPRRGATLDERAQRSALVDALAKGAPAFGCIGEVWTTKRIAAVINELFGGRYHPAHVSRLVPTPTGLHSLLHTTRAR